MLLFRLKRYTNVKYKFEKEQFNIQTHIYTTWINSVLVFIVYVLHEMIYDKNYLTIITYMKNNIHEYVSSESRPQIYDLIEYYRCIKIDTKNLIESLKTSRIHMSNNEPYKKYKFYTTKMMYDYVKYTGSMSYKLRSESITYIQNNPYSEIEYEFFYKILVRINQIKHTCDFFIQDAFALPYSISVIDNFKKHSTHQIGIYYKNMKHNIKYANNKEETKLAINNAIAIINSYKEKKNAAKLFKRIFAELEEIKNSMNKKPKLF